MNGVMRGSHRYICHSHPSSRFIVSAGSCLIFLRENRVAINSCVSFFLCVRLPEFYLYPYDPLQPVTVPIHFFQKEKLFIRRKFFRTGMIRIVRKQRGGHMGTFVCCLHFFLGVAFRQFPDQYMSPKSGSSIAETYRFQPVKDAGDTHSCRVG